ncbi:MAG: dTMP kinase [Deltaproteobacteria bacterium]|nr:dTMP kinase [Deltaproteobacteria bacterium]
MSPPSRARGCLITVEGIDGAGKSTQVERLAALLAGRGHRLVTTREPGATPLGRELRRMVLGRELALAPDAELFLFLADRAEHVATVITPALAEGAVVLCDRFTDSTMAYQGHGRSRDLARVRRWNAESAAGVVPDLTLLLDCPIELGAERRHRETDRYQALDRAFHERVRAGFLAEAAAASGRVHRIDASRALSDVSAEVARVTVAWLDAHGFRAAAASASA